jgi:serine/threonine protein phosphatase 1
MNIYAIGDVHGEFYKLKALMDRLNPEKDSKIIFVGDYIDRGSFSYEVVDYLVELSKKFDCVFIEGNHENMFMDFISGINEDLFIYNGGQRTITSYEQHGWDINKFTPYLDRSMPREHITFFQNTVKYYETDDFIFVHAGIAPNTPLENTPDEILIWDRSFQHMDHYKGKVVVFGHSPHSMILNEKYRICIDTGACFESMGDLTGVKLPERTFIRQGWTLEDMDDNKNTGEEDGKDLQEGGDDLPDGSEGSWSV